MLHSHLLYYKPLRPTSKAKGIGEFLLCSMDFGEDVVSLWNVEYRLMLARHLLAESLDVLDKERNAT